jgi:hypothetical protein
MRVSTVTAALATVLGVAAGATADTSFFLEKTSGPASERRAFTAADGLFQATSSQEVVSGAFVCMSPGCSGEFWYLTLAPPPGSPLAIGTYEQATGEPSARSPGLPALEVWAYVQGWERCPSATGRFVLGDLTVAPDGSVTSLGGPGRGRRYDPARHERRAPAGARADPRDAQGAGTIHQDRGRCRGRSGARPARQASSDVQPGSAAEVRDVLIRAAAPPQHRRRCVGCAEARTAAPPRAAYRGARAALQ